MDFHSQLISTAFSQQRMMPAVVPSLRLGKVIRDYDTVWPADEEWPKGITHVSRPTRNKAKKDANGKWIQGLPATARSEGGINVVLTERLQKWSHKQSCLNSGLWEGSTYAKSSFASLWRGNAFASDHVGSGTHHDYVNDTNVTAPDMVFKAMATCDATLKILGEKIVSKVLCYVVQAINVLTDDVERYSLRDTHLWYTPQISRREMRLPWGSWLIENKVIPFSMYYDRSVVWLFSTQDYLYIPKYRVRLV